MFSILILTYNEGKNLPACLDSVAWADDVVVLDSYSKDDTVAVAEARGARVFQRAFDDFGSQRNHALDHVTFKNPWVFHLDADEHFNEELRQECEQAITRDEHSAYFVPNRIIFMGRWIPHCTQYPHPQVRLIKLGEVRFAKAGHGQREDAAQRGVGHIHTGYDHYNFSKGLTAWVDKHNHYSTEEAQNSIDLARQSIHLNDLLTKDFMRRRRTLKSIQTRLPARWIFKFLYLYVARRGFLDGRPGFAFCVLHCFYDLFITIKIAELKKGPVALPSLLSMSGESDSFPDAETWIDKHNAYSETEARTLAGLLDGGESAWRQLSPEQQRHYRKLRKKCFPLCSFFKAYFFKSSLLKGVSGFHQSLLKAWYFYILRLKAEEFRGS